MNKSDIRLEAASCVKELRTWIPPLTEASPALAAVFTDLAASIEEKAARNAYDSYGATLMRGKVNGLTLAAHTLLEELKARR